MLMEACTAVKRDKENKKAVFQCRIDGKDVELTIPGPVLAKWVWATWAQHAVPEGTARLSVPIPVEAIGSATTQDSFVLTLQVPGGWEVPLEIQRSHLQPLRNLLADIELFYSDPANPKPA